MKKAIFIMAIIILGGIGIYLFKGYEETVSVCVTGLQYDIVYEREAQMETIQEKVAMIKAEQEEEMRRLAELYKPKKNEHATLSVPTHITQVEGLYVILDCYHNQVIFNDNLVEPLTEWKVMISDLNRPHTLASDGEIYVIDDTDNHQLVVMKRVEAEGMEPTFAMTQEVEGVGNRPHYTIYHEESGIFYVWSSQNGEMYLFKRKEGIDEIELKEIKRIPELCESYVRSFTIIDDCIYFVSGNNNVIEADLESFAVLEYWPVVPEIGGMVQMNRIQSYYYITVSTDSYGNAACATMIRTADLATLGTGEYEVIYDLFEATGTPYYMIQMDESWYLTHHKAGTQIWKFEIVDDVISNIEAVY